MIALLVVLGVGAGIGFAIHPVVGGLIATVLGIAAIVVSVQINVQRLHDIGWSGWLYLLNFVPIVGSVFPLLLLFIPGTTGANRFGAPPPPNTTAVKVLAWMWLIIPVVFGILAAISIPAYQDYVERSEMSSYEMPADGDNADYAEPTDEAAPMQSRTSRWTRATRPPNRKRTSPTEQPPGADVVQPGPDTEIPDASFCPDYRRLQRPRPGPGGSPGPAGSPPDPGGPAT